jgi:hypothetical protein
VDELWQTIQPYSGWIIVGIFLLLMIGTRGGCCGIGHRSHGQRQAPAADDKSARTRSASLPEAQATGGVNKNDPASIHDGRDRLDLARNR